MPIFYVIIFNTFLIIIFSLFWTNRGWFNKMLILFLVYNLLINNIQPIFGGNFLKIRWDARTHVRPWYGYTDRHTSTWSLPTKTKHRILCKPTNIICYVNYSILCEKFKGATLKNNNCIMFLIFIRIWYDRPSRTRQQDQPIRIQV